MIPFKLLIRREEALKRVLDTVKPINRTEKIPIEEATNRVLGENINAKRYVPPFNRAAMDGYAVKAPDTYGASEQNPQTLRLIAVLHAGESTDAIVSNRECIRIATGCPIPIGADAVIMVEFTEEKKEQVSVFKTVHPGANISQKGEDIMKGEVVLEAGVLLNPAKLGVMAALGKKQVLVYSKPRVAVMSTGPEICRVGSKLKRGEVYDVNSYTLSALFSLNGAIVTRSDIIPDSFDEIESAISRFLNHDLIVFSGGSSVGERDFLARVIQQTGKVLFHGVQIKPGKPTLFGVVKGKPIFGMPGYPTSCLSNAYIFLISTIRKMARLTPKEPRIIKTRMGRRVVSSSGREQVLPVRIVKGRAYPIFKRSGAITSLARADGYILLPINLDVVEEDEKVTVTLFNW